MWITRYRGMIFPSCVLAPYTLKTDRYSQDHSIYRPIFRLLEHVFDSSKNEAGFGFGEGCLGMCVSALSNFFETTSLLTNCKRCACYIYYENDSMY